MKNYFLAKRKLFDLVKDKKNSIINIDDEYGKRYYQYTDGISYGIENYFRFSKCWSNRKYNYGSSKSRRNNYYRKCS